MRATALLFLRVRALRGALFRLGGLRNRLRNVLHEAPSRGRSPGPVEGMGGGLPFDGKTADRDPLQEKGRELEVLLPASCEMFEKPQAEADVIGRADFEKFRRAKAPVLVTSRGFAGGPA